VIPEAFSVRSVRPYVSQVIRDIVMFTAIESAAAIARQGRREQARVTEIRNRMRQ
jgi:hypothetical protein